ncbi:hypothetical protein E2I00_006379, partial [Balaenoptera physalus]
IYTLCFKMSKFSNHVTIKKRLISQAGIGLSANTFLLFHIIILLLDRRPPSCLPLGPLIFLTVALLMLMDMFGRQNFQTDFSCKTLVYLYRVMRGLSIGTPCLLSMLQFLNVPFCSNLVIYTVPSSNVSSLIHVYHYIIKDLFFLLSLFGDISFVGIMLLSRAYIVEFLISSFSTISWMNNPVILGDQRLVVNG